MLAWCFCVSVEAALERAAETATTKNQSVENQSVEKQQVEQ